MLAKCVKNIKRSVFLNKVEYQDFVTLLKTGPFQRRL